MSLAERDPGDGFAVLVKSVAKVKRNEATPEELEEKTIDLGQYDPMGDLGRGSFSRVTRYTRRETGEEIAVKVVDVSRSPRALREVAILSQLTHPCILGLVGVVLPRPDDPTLQIATDLIRPGPLDQLISGGHLTTPTEQVKVIAGILMGMRYLHRSGIIHRDLKPANVLVDHHLIAKIADFGTSKVLNVDIANTLGTGTPLYQAPEILQGRDDYGFPADVYSFGCMCFEILTGRRVFLQKSFVHVGIAAVEGIRPDIPGEWSPLFGELVDRSWAVDSRRRPTFDEWFQCLQDESFRVTDDVNRDEVIALVEGITAWERNYE
jgi:serine/threonine-protein kinase